MLGRESIEVLILSTSPDVSYMYSNLTFTERTLDPRHSPSSPIFAQSTQLLTSFRKLLFPDSLPSWYGRLQCSQASSPSVFCLGRDGRQIVVHPNPCPGRAAGPYRCLSLTAIFKFPSRESVLEETKHLYYNAIIIFGYQVSNFLINQPSCALISDPRNLP